MVIAVLGDCQIRRTEAIDHFVDESRSQKRRVAGGDVRYVGVGCQCQESSVDSCKGAGICMDVASNEDVCWQFRKFLVGCGDDYDRRQRFTKAIHHVPEHRFRAERQGKFGGSHAAAVATTKHNSSDGGSRF